MVKFILRYFFGIYLFWMLFSFLNRLVFILFNINQFYNVDFLEIVKSFWFALPLDHAIACYLLVLPFLFIFTFSLFRYKVFLKITNWITYLFIFIISLITSAELGIYDEWKVKLNYKAISYIQHPDEVINSAKGYILFFGVLLLIFQTGIGIFLLNKILKFKDENLKKNYRFSIYFFLITPVFIFLGMRGGWQPIPINQSEVYFSKHNIVNLATVNSTYNLMHSIEQNRGFLTSNPFKYFDDKEVKNLIDKLHYVEKDTTELFLNESIKKPNLVFIILESWSADMLKCCGGYDSVSPCFDKLAKDGILFDNVISSGTVSDQGMAAILSGYPAQPTVSIIKQESKYDDLPCFAHNFQKDGYYTSFYFGGQLNYGNIKGFIYYNNFDKIIEQYDFDSSIPRGRLGVHDEFVFDRLINDLNSFKQPFLNIYFTLSTHSPFDFPMKYKFSWGGELNGYVNSVAYTDSCIGVFFEKAKKTEWYKNTVFVLMSDHSHGNPKLRPFHASSYRRIPLLFTGEPIKEAYKGKVIHKIFAQTDVTATLLAQFGYNFSEFHWSKNMMNPYTKEFAYYSFDNGVGWAVKDNNFAYDHDLNLFYDDSFVPSANKDSLIKDGKAYLQALFKEYSEF
ncbi:MAG: hypothetical protein A2046_09595 [Bacteroidetes bacterium GWA2_30_7]|nr:MAG: hypothetical protein A2046_09595 [Bacteroidetes bacterium GWA2_30_7]